MKRILTIIFFAFFGFLLAEGMSRAGVEFGTRLIVYAVAIALLIGIDYFRSNFRDGAL